VGLHNTDECEELLIPLSGEGELIIQSGESLRVCPGCVLYNPPHTEHDVRCTGNAPLEYVYVVTKPFNDHE